MTEKMIELLVGMINLLDRFLDMIGDAIIGESAGSGGIAILHLVTYVVAICLTVALIWNVIELVNRGASHGGDARRLLSLPHVKKIIHILIVALLMLGATRVFHKDPKGGSYMGISYATVAGKLSDSTMKSALSTLGAVDVVDQWVTCLYDFQLDRQERILKILAAKDPKVAETYAKRALFVDTGGWNSAAKMTVMEKLKTVGKGALAAASEGVTGLSRKFLLSMCLYGFAWAIVGICQFFFIFQAGRTILLLAFFVKLSALLTMMVLPAAIGLMYFERMRHFAQGVIKQLITLSLVAGVLGGAVQVVFSNTMIKQVLVMAMKGELGAYQGKLSEADVVEFCTTTDIAATASIAEELVAGPSFSVSEGKQMQMAASMDIRQILQTCKAVVKVMFLLGTMLMVISKLFDTIGGIMSGYWDPFAEGSKSAG